MLLRVKTIIFTAVLCLSTLTVCIANQDEESSDQVTVIENNIWVWADSSENKDAIFLTRGAENDWSTPEAISANSFINVVPAIIELNDGGAFVIWSAYENGQSKLLYRYESEGEWSEELTFPSELTQNTAPSAVIDSDGKVWIIWAGFNGVSDEIFYSTWDGQEFSTASAITDNDVPDILPLVGLNKESGAVWVEWKQYSTEGYLSFQAIYNGSEWGAPILVIEQDDEEDSDTQDAQSDDVAENESGQSEEVELIIPEVVTDVESASVHIPGNEIQSLPIRSMNIVKE